MLELTRKVMEDTFKLAAEYPGIPKVSFNVPPEGLTPSFLYAFKENVARAPDAARRVGVEVTEEGEIKPEHWSVVSELHSMGVRLSMDDFGTQATGSTQSHFERLLMGQELYRSKNGADGNIFNTVKLDGPFVDEKSNVFLQLAVGLIRNLGVPNIVGERNVTDQDTLYLLNQGVPVVQGWNTGEKIAPETLLLVEPQILTPSRQDDALDLNDLVSRILRPFDPQNHLQLPALARQQAAQSARRPTTQAPPDGAAAPSLLDTWANQASTGITSLLAARNAYFRELSSYYRSGFNPSFANRRAFEDGLLDDLAAHHNVAFMEVPGTLKAVNDSVGHLEADKLLQGLMTVATEIAADPRFDQLTMFHLGAARFAFQGPPDQTEAFTERLSSRIAALEFGYIADGVRYEQLGMPLVRHKMRADSQPSRRAFLFEGMDRLERATEPLKGTVLPEQRGGALLTLHRSDAQGQPSRAWVTDPQAQQPAPDTQGSQGRAQDLLGAPLLQALHRRAVAVTNLEEARRAIQDTVRRGFSTDEAMGGFLANQLAFDRAEHDRERANIPSWHGFVDVGGVGLTNMQVSRFAGDAVLSAVHGAAAATAKHLNTLLELRGADRIEVFAVGGDEIRFVTSTQALAELYAQSFAQDMKLAAITGVTGEPGQPLQAVSLLDVPVYIGTGSSQESAETMSNDQKASDPRRQPGRLPLGYQLQEIDSP